MGEPDDKVARLVAVVGPDRGSHSPEEVAAAERELERIAEGEHYATLRGTERNGCLASAIGAVLVLMFLLCPYELTGDFKLMAVPGDPWHSYVLPVVLRLTWALWLASGIILIVSGLGFLEAREWARGVIAAVLTYNILHYAAALALMDAGSVHHTGWTRETVLWAAIWNVSLGALIGGLWCARRYFRSERVRKACRASGNPSGEAEK